MKARSIKTTLILATYGVFLQVYCLSISFADTSGRWSPSPPPKGLFQDPQKLSPKGSQTIENLIVQHEKLTGERVLIVVLPWSGEKPDLDAQETAQLLAKRWRLDTTYRGASVLVVIQEKKPGRLQVAYVLGVGLARSQMASHAQMDGLKEVPERFSKTLAWDQLVEFTLTWVFQTLESPILNTLALRSVKEPTAFLKQEASGERPSLIHLFFLAILGISLFVLNEVIRQATRPKLLIGSNRILRFTLLDQIQEGLRKRVSRPKKKTVPLSIISLEGSP